jgi:hypothetical protein
MNERMKDLVARIDRIKDMYDVGPVQRAAIEDFAELIIRECCEVAHCNFHVDGLTLGGILKEHFGVKE